MVDIVTNVEAGSAEERRQQIQKEYGTWVANEPVTIDGVLAFAKGHPVPISHVEAYPALIEEDEHGNAPVITVEEYAKQAEADAAPVDAPPAAEPDKAPEPVAAKKAAAAAPKAETPPA